MHTLLGELGYHLKAVPICGDNQGSIFITSNPITEKRSKHIDIRFHYIREVIDRGLVTLYFVDGENNPADLLTLGAEGVIPGRYIVSFLRVFKQFTHTLPSR